MNFKLEKVGINTEERYECIYTTIDENGNIVKVSRWEVASQTYQEIYTEWAYENCNYRMVWHRNHR